MRFYPSLFQRSSYQKNYLVKKIDLQNEKAFFLSFHTDGMIRNWHHSSGAEKPN